MAIALTNPGLLAVRLEKDVAPYHMYRVLLALDASRLSSRLQAEVLARCVPLTDRLDILLVNPPKEPTSMLHVLLLRLEHSGIDYRLASTDGDLGEQVQHYLNRFQAITHVLVDNMASLERAMGAKMAELRSKGYRFMPISDANDA